MSHTLERDGVVFLFNGPHPGLVEIQRKVFGKPRKYGPFYLWGNFPDFELTVPPQKERIRGNRPQDRARRAAVPYALSEALYQAIERDRNEK